MNRQLLLRGLEYTLIIVIVALVRIVSYFFNKKRIFCENKGGVYSSKDGLCFSKSVIKE